MGTGRLKRQKIMLPVSGGEVNYKYMEDFIKNIEQKQINSVLKYLDEYIYILNRKIKGFGEVRGKAIVQDGVFTVLKGSICVNNGKGYVPLIRRQAKIIDNILQEDVICNNPSSAGWVVIGKSNKGWKEWKDVLGKPIDRYRA